MKRKLTDQPDINPLKKYAMRNNSSQQGAEDCEESSKSIVKTVPIITVFKSVKTVSPPSYIN